MLIEDLRNNILIRNELINPNDFNSIDQDFHTKHRYINLISLSVIFNNKKFFRKNKQKFNKMIDDYCIHGYNFYDYIVFTKNYHFLDKLDNDVFKGIEFINHLYKKDLIPIFDQNFYHIKNKLNHNSFSSLLLKLNIKNKRLIELIAECSIKEKKYFSFECLNWLFFLQKYNIDKNDFFLILKQFKQNNLKYQLNSQSEDCLLKFFDTLNYNEIVKFSSRLKQQNFRLNQSLLTNSLNFYFDLMNNYSKRIGIDKSKNLDQLISILNYTNIKCNDFDTQSRIIDNTIINNSRVSKINKKAVDENLKIILPETNLDLLEWTAAMKNCVYFYRKKINQKNNILIGIEKNQKIKYLLLIEDGIISEFYGYANSNVPAKIRNSVYEFLLKNKVLKNKTNVQLFYNKLYNILKTIMIGTGLSFGFVFFIILIPVLPILLPFVILSLFICYLFYYFSSQNNQLS